MTSAVDNAFALVKVGDGKDINVLLFDVSCWKNQ